LEFTLKLGEYIKKIFVVLLKHKYVSFQIIILKENRSERHKTSIALCWCVIIHFILSLHLCTLSLIPEGRKHKTGDARK